MSSVFFLMRVLTLMYLIRTRSSLHSYSYAFPYLYVSVSLCMYVSTTDISTHMYICVSIQVVYTFAAFHTTFSQQKRALPRRRIYGQPHCPQLHVRPVSGEETRAGACISVGRCLMRIRMRIPSRIFWLPRHRGRS